MASLTESAYYTRRAVNWGILLIALYFVLRILWAFLIAFWVFVFPPKPPPPNNAFGKLPAISFPAPVSPQFTQLTFSLETVDGGLPRASDSATVYFMPKAAANLLALSNTQQFAKRLDFDITPYQETKTIYRFEDLQFPLRKLRYDIVSNNFVLKYGFEQDTSIFSEGTIRDPGAAEQDAKNLLQTYLLYKPDFVNGEKKVTNLRLVGNTLVPIQNLSQTDAMRVDFFRSSVNKLGVVTPNPDEGQIRVTFSGSKNPKKQLVELVYTYWPIDYQTSATYQLKSIDQAWQELQEGKGFIAKYPINGEASAAVRNVYLGYYDSFDPQTYLQPVYVFQGDHEFTAYIHAISSEFVE